MITDKLKAIIEQFKEQGNMRFFDGASKENIAKFEATYAIKFPERYKEWLEFSDGGDCFLPAGVQFYGVSHKPIIDVDCSDRPDNTYVVVGALSTGDPILFKKGSEQISIYNQEANRIEDDEIYTDFIAFLDDLYDLLGIEG